MPHSGLIPLIFALFVVAVTMTWSLFGKKWDPRGKHCYVTGGSTGLGLHLAILLAKNGANVSIVARNQTRLDEALLELEKCRKDEGQIFKAYSYSLNEFASSEAALEAVCVPYGGRAPDAVFACAGASKPGFFFEQDEASLRSGMDHTYWVQAFTALAASKHMAKDKVAGKIVFVSSILGYFGFIGYSSYSPGKFALRGLAETLRSEFLLYNISVHIYFPATIYSPGYEEENKTKPKITLKIEEADEGLQPAAAAAILFNGVQNGDFHIAGDLVGNLFRSSTRGATPHNNVLLDVVYSMIGRIGLTVWRRSVDATVIGHRAEHQAYLAERKVLN